MHLPLNVDSVQDRTLHFSPAAAKGASLRSSGIMARFLGAIENIYETDSGHSRIVPMEGLRGWAVLLVFFVHSHTALSGFLSSTSPCRRLPLSRHNWQRGRGSVFCDQWIPHLWRGSATSIPICTLLLRRVQRIYPAFLAVISIYLFLGFFSSNEHFKFYGSLPQKASFILQNLLLMPGNFPSGLCWR